MMWVEYLPIGGHDGDRQLVNFATANKLYLEAGGKGWWVKADLTGRPTTLCPRELTRDEANQSLKALIALVKSETGYVELEQWYACGPAPQRGRQ